MDITLCRHCQRNVLPLADHACPSCGRDVRAGRALGDANPFTPTLIERQVDLSEAELILRIAKKEQGVRVAKWWMGISSLVIVVVIATAGLASMGGLSVICLASGIVGYSIDARALRRLRARARQLSPAGQEAAKHAPQSESPG